MGLLAMELLTVGTCVLLWLVALVLLLFSVSAVQLGTLGFLATASLWLEFFFGRVAVGIHAVH